MTRCDLLTKVLGSPPISNMRSQMTDKLKLVSAVNYLIAAPNYAKLINEMTGIIERWDTHPMVYGGKLEMLNAVIDVGLQNREAFEKLLRLIEQKRRLVPQTKRTDYQRQLMRERRARIAKALELAELTSGRLSTGDRKAREKALIERWRQARDEFIANKGNLSWAERNTASNEFWETIDRQLDQNLREARRPR